ncbi:MAG: AAA family ATPase, partial [Deltaproteobacteria bacterium]|nr:AAA family ATPase [Deltaproteobacteria bacterium]
MRQLARSLAIALALAFALAPASADAQKARGARKARVTKAKRKTPVSHKKVVMFVGMPGSGKSFVSQKLAEKLKLPKPLVSGDVIREAAGKAKNPKEQGERVLKVARKFAKMKGEIGRRMALKAKRLKGDTVIIEGFRNPHDLVAFKKAFPNTVVVSLEVPDGVRHKRQLARGRAGED